MDKELELLKAFNTGDRRKVSLINTQAINIIALEPMVSGAKGVLETPEVQEAAERLLTMDKELKAVEAYHLMLSAISALKDINKSLPTIPERWRVFFSQRFPAFSDLLPSKPKFAQNCFTIRQILETEIAIFEQKTAAVVNGLSIKVVEIGRGAE